MALQIKQSYQHTQEVPATDWVIVHGMGRDVICDVSVLVDGEYQKILPKSIQVVDDSTVKVSFSVPFKGKARLA